LDCILQKMAYFSRVLKKILTFTACFLAILSLGVIGLRVLSPAPCAAADSCCCSDPATPDPCVCGDHAASNSPEMAAFGGLPNLVAPPVKKLLIGEITPLADLLPKWQPAVPWRAPPEETRTRLSVWIL
jgi:hypothetical protein